jgi:hypothetical protein
MFYASTLRMESLVDAGNKVVYLPDLKQVSSHDHLFEGRQINRAKNLCRSPTIGVRIRELTQGPKMPDFQ